MKQLKSSKSHSLDLRLQISDCKYLIFNRKSQIANIKSQIAISGTLNRALLSLCLGVLTLTLSACNDKSPDITPTPTSAPASSTAEAAKEGERIIQQYCSLANWKDETMKMSVKIQEDDGQSR